MVARRGEIWWATLPAPRGSEPGLDRPVVIVSSDEFNKSSIQTLLVVPITSNVRLAGAPGNVRLRRRDSGLPKDSTANVSQLLTLDKNALIERVRAVHHERMRDIDAGLRLILSL